MIHVTESFTLHIPLPLSCPKEKLLFFDIETTGLSAKNSMVYLIGCICQEEEGWKLTQYFCDDPGDEPELLNTFFSLLSSYSVLVHYNGDSFDIPFLKEKARQLSVPQPFDTVKSLDLYKKIRPFKHLLGLSSLKQIAVENLFHIRRADKKSGKELIAIYRNYVLFPSKDQLELLLLHNHDDLTGLLGICKFFSFSELFSGNFTIDKASILQDGPNTKLSVSFTCALPFEDAYTYIHEGYSLSVAKDSCTLSIPIFEGELLYFYKDFKNYYYLPKEDTAIHKSVGAYIEPEFRKKATAATCYTKKQGNFLFQPKELFTPCFRKDYTSKELFFLCDDTFLNNSVALQKYVLAVLPIFL